MTEFETKMLAIKEREVKAIETSNEINKTTTIGSLIILENILRDYSSILIKISSGEDDDILDDINAMFTQMSGNIEILKQSLFDI